MTVDNSIPSNANQRSGSEPSTTNLSAEGKTTNEPTKEQLALKSIRQITWRTAVKRQNNRATI